jgi:hypothetical protein
MNGTRTAGMEVLLGALRISSDIFPELVRKIESPEWLAVIG